MMLEDFGMMTEPMPDNRVQYDLRALDKYCSEKKYFQQIYQKKN